MRYDSFSYLWPPRPETAVDASMLHVFEKKGYIAQLKMNGTNSVIFVAPDKTVTAMTRHGVAHKAWSPTPEVMSDFAKLKGQGWYVFVAELLHSKVAGLRDINYVHDVLVRDGEYLVGYTQEDRQDILHDLLMTDNAKEMDHHFVVSPHLWLPIEYESGFSVLFKGLCRPENEGLVLKDPRQRLALCTKAKSNTAGIFKVRRFHDNYSF